MKFELMRSCGGGNCPSIYRTDEETYLIQGRLRELNGEIPLAEGEVIIEVPKDLLGGYGITTE